MKNIIFWSISSIIAAAFLVLVVLSSIEVSHESENLTSSNVEKIVKYDNGWWGDVYRVEVSEWYMYHDISQISPMAYDIQSDNLEIYYTEDNTRLVRVKETVHYLLGGTGTYIRYELYVNDDFQISER